MKKQNPHITDEHIVAYLDGELNASPEFKRDLHADPELALASKEYAAIGNAMARSSADERFMLSASTDKSTKKMLADSLAKSRKAIRTAAPAPSAAPVRSIPAQRSVKYLWAKRTSMGFAFATLLALLWINFNGKNEQFTQVPVPSNINKAPAPEQIAPVAPQVNPASSGQLAVSVNEQTHSPSASSLPVKKHVEQANHSEATNDIATNTTSQTEAPHTTIQDKEDPADIMISHRYAKLIKATRMVEVTEQDKM